MFQHYLASNRGRTGNMRFPNDESCVTKYPKDRLCACWRAALWEGDIMCASVDMNTGCQTDETWWH